VYKHDGFAPKCSGCQCNNLRLIVSIHQDDTLIHTVLDTQWALAQNYAFCNTTCNSPSHKCQKDTATPRMQLLAILKPAPMYWYSQCNGSS